MTQRQNSHSDASDDASTYIGMDFGGRPGSTAISIQRVNPSAGFEKIGNVIGLLPETTIPQMSEFRDQFLRQIADGLGISFDAMTEDHARMNPVITPQMIRLAASWDRRQRKRGYRIFRRVNGSGAHTTALWFQAEQYRRWQALRRLARAVHDKLYEKFLMEDDYYADHD